MSRPMPVRPFDAQPVLHRAGGTGRERADVFGVSRRTVCRYARSESLSADQADRLAIAAGYHPCEIWGDDWWLRDDEDAEGVA